MSDKIVKTVETYDFYFLMYQTWFDCIIIDLL